MDKVVQLAATLQAEATQVALLSQNERNALVARVQLLQKENQRHLELEAQLMARVKMLEHAVWQLRRRCGEEAGAEPGKEAAPAAAVAAVKKRQHSRRALLARLLQENGVEAGANLAGMHLAEYELRPPVASPALVVSAAAVVVAASPVLASPPASPAAALAPPSSPSGLEDLQALARGIGGMSLPAEEPAPAPAPASAVPAVPAAANAPSDKARKAQEAQEQRRREAEEEEQLAKSLGVDASKMMKRMGGGGTPIRRKGAAAAQLVAAALGAPPNRAAASPLAPVTGGFGSPGPSVAAPIKVQCLSFVFFCANRY